MRVTLDPSRITDYRKFLSIKALPTYAFVGRTADGPDDTKHICPLQLGIIDRVVRLYSNPGEIVFSPFAGIGSEGFSALKLMRRFYGCELKDEYVSAARKNMERAIVGRNSEQSMMLFPLDTPSALVG